MSLQLSLIPTETATAPMGLEYHSDFLAVSEEEGLLAHIDNSEWLTDLSRRVLHFGYKYDYTSRRLDETARIGPLPEWLTQLSNMVREAASEEAKQLLDPHQPFEQAIINEYLPGQGIAPHIDRDCFGPIVATVSLGLGGQHGFLLRFDWRRIRAASGAAQPRPSLRRCPLQVASWHRQTALRHLERPKDQASATRFDHVSHHCRNRAGADLNSVPI